MNNYQAEAKRLIEEKNASLVILSKNNPPYIDYGPGLLPLWKAWQKGSWKGAFLADRVIGRGSAFLAVAMDIKGIFTPILSEGAEVILHNYCIQCSFEKKVPRIADRSGKGICPMEALLEGINEPELAIAKLDEFFSKKKNPG